MKLSNKRGSSPLLAAETRWVKVIGFYTKKEDKKEDAKIDNGNIADKQLKRILKR